MNDNTEIKRLTICEIEIAKYTIDNGILFINPTELGEFKYTLKDQMIYDLIVIVEKRLFNGMAYLNLKKS